MMISPGVNPTTGSPTTGGHGRRRIKTKSIAPPSNDTSNSSNAICETTPYPASEVVIAMDGTAVHRNQQSCGAGFKRKRVAQACHTCRSMKSKCDGKWPECSRCLGYGYRCAYDAGKRRHEAAFGDDDDDDDNLGPASDGAVRAQGELRTAIHQYEALLGHDALNDLPSEERQREACSVLARMKAADRALSGAGACFATTTKLPARAAPPDAAVSGAAASGAASPWPRLPRGERYLGEVSDVRFFNLVKQMLQAQQCPVSLSHDVDSYEQQGDIASPNITPGKLARLPSPEAAKTFADVYFNTVHLAFPFIPQASFMKSLGQVQGSSNDADVDRTKLALIYVICAIGAYYTILPGEQIGASRSHEVYFLQALSLAFPPGMDRSVDYVSLLLAQCFYLLAVCRTDSCWVTLGQTVRMAQSIGLHVEQRDPDRLAGPGRLPVERRRRVWYCIYVLDRLVSLQLGRPPAIHEDYCNVPLPSRLGDSDIDWDVDEMPASPEGPSVGDYHLAVISFSKIISQVLQDLHSTTAGQDMRMDLLNTRNLDRQLLQWKLSLPRTLRFDLGHTFDKSFIFKRQRSMFAIKYHHLRTLIHRPYLCYPLLRNLDGSAEIAITQVNWPVVSSYEKTCIAEAREIARLMHSISSEKDLVQDFPWWQMIPCLMCAGSILVVSSTFIQQTDDALDGFDVAGISDDAETCLRVFEALSANSKGARIARDMMEGLKECGLRWSAATIASGSQCPTSEAQALNAPGSSGAAPPASRAVGDAAETQYGAEQGGLTPDAMMHTPSSWPAEIVDSMAWSAQFFEAVQQK